MLKDRPMGTPAADIHVHNNTYHIVYNTVTIHAHLAA